jgi:hypothetical protein
VGSLFTNPAAAFGLLSVVDRDAATSCEQIDQASQSIDARNAEFCPPTEITALLDPRPCNGTSFADDHPAFRFTQSPNGYRQLGPAEFATRFALLERMRTILAKHVDFLPLTLWRLVFRLVGTRSCEKSEQAYNRLGKALSRSRLASVR